jgi:hypothetical protein
MAGVSRPSFTKKLKEQKRLAKAAAKREARSARRRAQGLETQETPILEAPLWPQEES